MFTSAIAGKSAKQPEMPGMARIFHVRGVTKRGQSCMRTPGMGNIPSTSNEEQMYRSAFQGNTGGVTEGRCFERSGC
jgi:hypothetical protein